MKKVSVKQMLAGLTVFILGLLMSPNGGETIKEVEICSNNNVGSYKEIILKDEEIIDLMSDGLNYAAEGYQAISDGDKIAINAVTIKTNKLADELSMLRLEREALFEKLDL